MRTFELRVYTLAPKKRSISTGEVVYPHHLRSFSLFGIEAHGFWTATADLEPRLFVLVSYAAGKNPARSDSGISKARHSPTTPGTSMFPASRA